MNKFVLLLAFLVVLTYSQACGIDGCLSCDENDKCQECDRIINGWEQQPTEAGICQCDTADGFFDDQDDYCYYCGINFASCKTCDNQTCITCNDGFILNTTAKECYGPCQPTTPGCSTCDEGPCTACYDQRNLTFFQGSCVCKPGFERRSPEDFFCVPCNWRIWGCDTCEDNGQCTACDTAGFFENTTDSEGDPICFCIVGYFPEFEQNWANVPQCTPCSERHDNCNECDFQDCYECLSDQYALDSDMECVTCATVVFANCFKCSDNTTCTECSTGFILVGTSCNLCSSTIDNCTACSGENVCTDCQDGYYVNDSDECSPCSVGCQDCSSAQACTTCSDEDNFQPDGDGGCQCPDGYFLFVDQCLSCPDAINGCTLCSNFTTCTQCNSANNFVLNEETDFCDCASGFYIQLMNCSVCSSAIPNCVECSDDSTCTDCRLTYFVDEQDSCTSCSVGCLICISSDECTTCDEQNNFEDDGEEGCQCEDGYFLADGECFTCRSELVGCDICSDAETCSSCNAAQNFSLNIVSDTCYCRESYFLNPSLGCSLCSTQIPFCSRCSNYTHCSSCIDQYIEFFNSSSSITSCQLCNVTLTGCTLCTETTVCTNCDSARNFVPNGTNCICRSGYYFISANSSCNSCSVFSTNCLTCSNSTCLTCASNYFVNGTSCSLRCNISVCLSCWNSTDCALCGPFSTISQNRQACLCNNGYYLDGNQCSSCSSVLPNCNSCVSPTICIGCAEGFAVNLQTLKCEEFGENLVLKMVLVALVIIGMLGM